MRGLLGLFFPLVGLLTPGRRPTTSPDGILGHPTRRRILELVANRPGTNPSDLCEGLAVPRSTVQYHLDLLRRARFVSRLSDGKEQHYFLGDAPPTTGKKLTLLQRGRVMQVVSAIRDKPGLMQKELVEKINISRKVIRQYLNLLTTEELVKEVRVAKTRRYYAMDEVDAVLSKLPAPVPAGAPEPPAADDFDVPRAPAPPTTGQKSEA